MSGTVLVIEDDAATAALLCEVLAEEGYCVLTAVGGAGLDAAVRAQPLLILLDVRMPGMDGAEVSQRLRANPQTAHIPIVGLSAHSKGQPSEMQVDGFVVKPFSLQELWTTVRQHLRAGETSPAG